MIKIALSALAGAVIGAYAVSSPLVSAADKQGSLTQAAINPAELMLQVRNMPVTEVKEPY